MTRKSRATNQEVALAMLRAWEPILSPAPSLVVNHHQAHLGAMIQTMSRDASIERASRAKARRVKRHGQ